jgi:hypothetical protein
VTTGIVDEPGEAGLTDRAEGGAGGAESFVKLTPDEHGEPLPTASVAVALIVDVVFGVTGTSMPAPASSAAVPVADAGPLQSLVRYSFTVEPGSALPLTATVVAAVGEAGDNDESEGAAGGVESSR